MSTSQRPADIAISRPRVGEAGATGDWRSKRPVMEAALCSAGRSGKVSCQICWVYCPDACITQGAPPQVDLTYCKGCGICAEMCPTGALVMIQEEEHGVCVIDDSASAEEGPSEP